MHWDTLKKDNYTTVRGDGGSRVGEDYFSKRNVLLWEHVPIGNTVKYTYRSSNVYFEHSRLYSELMGAQTSIYLTAQVLNLFF